MGKGSKRERRIAKQMRKEQKRQRRANRFQDANNGNSVGVGQNKIPLNLPPPNGTQQQRGQAGSRQHSLIGTHGRDHADGEMDKAFTSLNKATLPDGPCLCFMPIAWAKLNFICQLANTEIGGFGVCGLEEEDGNPTRELLTVTDFVLVKQSASDAFVKFHDVAVADHIEDMIEAGVSPERSTRIWIHTHPNISASPSTVDEQTFDEAFGNNTWSVMAILARNGETFARLRFNVGPGGHQDIKTFILTSRDPDFEATQEMKDQWEAEYNEKVSTIDDLNPTTADAVGASKPGAFGAAGAGGSSPANTFGADNATQQQSAGFQGDVGNGFGYEGGFDVII